MTQSQIPQVQRKTTAFLTLGERATAKKSPLSGMVEIFTVHVEGLIKYVKKLNLASAERIERSRTLIAESKEVIKNLRQELDATALTLINSDKKLFDYAERLYAGTLSLRETREHIELLMAKQKNLSGDQDPIVLAELKQIDAILSRANDFIGIKGEKS